MSVSWLNLHRWIPQRDVRKLIYRLLGPYERMIVKYAHLSKYVDTGEFIIEQLPYYSASYGYLNLLKWSIEQNKYVHYENVCFYASRRGHLDLVQWVVAVTGYHWPNVFVTAAQNGHVHILEWWKKSGYKIDKSVCLGSGYSRVVEWIKNQ